MSRLLSSLVCALAVSLAAGSTAAAAPLSPSGGTPAPQTEKADGEKRLQHRDRHRRDWRDRHRDRRYDRPHHRRHHDRDRWDRDNRYRYGSACWVEPRRAHYHGRPALISVRICRDRYGRHHVDYRSQRLIRYIARHDRHRRW